MVTTFSFHARVLFKEESVEENREIRRSTGKRSRHRREFFQAANSPSLKVHRQLTPTVSIRALNAGFSSRGSKTT